jgi:hypothetical protein
MIIAPMPDNLARAAVLDGHPIPWEVLTGPERLEVRQALAALAQPLRPGSAQETADRAAELLAAAPPVGSEPEQ